MPVVRTKYRAPHTSERAFTPYNSCRLVTLVAARAYETLGEQITRQNGTPYSHADRVTLAKLLRRHASDARGESPAEAKGYNRTQALYAYGKTFPTGDAVPVNPTPTQMRDLLKGGWFLSVSGSVDDVPGRSPLDDWVSDYPHEIGVCPFPTDYGPLVVEPMRPKGAGLIRISWSDLWRFSSEFADDQGRRLAIKVKAGWDTAKNRTARALNREMRMMTLEHTRTVTRIRKQRDAAQAEVVDLTEQLTECREDSCDAQVEAVLDRLHEWEAAERTAL